MHLDLRRSRWVGRTLVATVMTLVSVAPLRAQSSDGFLFGAPQGTLTLRGGYSRARAGSDVFTDLTQNLTLSRSDFSGATVGGEVAIPVSHHLELSFDLGYMRTSSPSHYRGFTDNANREIEQVTELTRVPVTVNARLFLTPPGRSIGKFAWIPNTFTPWVGAGAGFMYYKLRQSGDFVDFQTNNVISIAPESSGSTPMAQAMAGVDVSLSPRLALTGDARYLLAKSPSLGSDFEGYQPIDLSGVALTLGLTVRF